MNITAQAVIYETVNTLTKEAVVTKDGRSLHIRTVKFPKSDKFKVYFSEVLEGARKTQTAIGKMEKNAGNPADPLPLENPMSLALALGIVAHLDTADGAGDKVIWDQFWGDVAASRPVATEDDSADVSGIISAAAVTSIDPLPVDPVASDDGSGDILSQILSGAKESTPAEASVPVDSFEARFEEALVQMAPLEETKTVAAVSESWGVL